MNYATVLPDLFVGSCLQVSCQSLIAFVKHMFALKILHLMYSNITLHDLAYCLCLQTPEDALRLREEAGVGTVFCLQQNTDLESAPAASTCL